MMIILVKISWNTWILPLHRSMVESAFTNLEILKKKLFTKIKLFTQRHQCQTWQERGGQKVQEKTSPQIEKSKNLTTSPKVRKWIQKLLCLSIPGGGHSGAVAGIGVVRECVGKDRSTPAIFHLLSCIWEETLHSILHSTTCSGISC